MLRWLRWHCPPDTGFEIRALAVWGRARYLSVTEAPHNTNFHTWMGKKHFCFFQTAETGNRTPNSGVKGSSANHYPRAPALPDNKASPDGSFVSTGLVTWGKGYQVRITVGPDICHRGGAYIVLQTVQMPGVYSVSYGTMKNHWTPSI